MTQTIDTIIAHYLGALFGAIESAQQKDGLTVDGDLGQLRGWLEYAVKLWRSSTRVMFCRDCLLYGTPAPENKDTCGNCLSHNVMVFYSAIDDVKMWRAGEIAPGGDK